MKRDLAQKGRQGTNVQDLTPAQLDEARTLIEQSVAAFNFEEIKFQDEDFAQNYDLAASEELAKIKKLEKVIAQSSKPFADAVRCLSG